MSKDNVSQENDSFFAQIEENQQQQRKQKQDRSFYSDECKTKIKT